MPRKRMIDPHIWEDPSFNKLSIGARLLFIGMISNADDEGYLRGDAGSLKRLIFGFGTEDITQWIAELQSLKNLHFFDKDGEIYAHLVKWEVWQKQQKDRIIPSGYPKCSKCLASATQLLTEVKGSKVKRSNKQPEVADAKEILMKNQVNELIGVFYRTVNPAINYGNRTMRGAAEWLIEKFGLEKTLRMAEYAVSLNGMSYAPQISDPYELRNKYTKLTSYKLKERK